MFVINFILKCVIPRYMSMFTTAVLASLSSGIYNAYEVWPYFCVHIHAVITAWEQDLQI